VLFLVLIRTNVLIIVLIIDCRHLVQTRHELRIQNRRLLAVIYRWYSLDLLSGERGSSTIDLTGTHDGGG